MKFSVDLMLMLLSLLSLSRNTCVTFHSLKNKIKIATTTLARDKEYKGFSKGNYFFLTRFLIFLFWKSFLAQDRPHWHMFTLWCCMFYLTSHVIWCPLTHLLSIYDISWFGLCWCLKKHLDHINCTWCSNFGSSNLCLVFQAKLK